MGRSGRKRAALVAGALTLAVVEVVAVTGLGIVAEPAAAAAPARKPTRAQTPTTTPPPPLDPAWFADRPRFEPLDGTPLTVAGIGDYRGAIELTRPTPAGPNLAVINAVSLEDYLRGVSEVPTAWPLEAQKAQAVAARTYAIWEATRKADGVAYKQAGADICATQGCQVYAGLAKERRAGSQSWLAAVAQTKGQLLLYKNAPIVAKYSSSNGGQTVSGGQPYLQATPDPDDAYSPLHQWRTTYAIGDVVRVAGLSAEPVELHRDDTQIVATYVDPDGNPVEERLPVEDFRTRVNNSLPTPAGMPSPLPSSRYDIQVEAGLVHIDGRGWGHGIGLSQYGALGKALRGMKAPDILAAYYAGLKPTTLPAEKLPQQVRVALALDRREVTVSSTGAFRVVAADGRVLAHRTTGSWTVKPAPATASLALLPPPDQAAPATAALAKQTPEHPKANKALQLTVNLDGPAAVTRIDLTPPGGATQVLDPPKLRLPGPLQVRLGAVHPGTYRIDLERDAGNGRVTTSTLTVEVPPLPGAAATRSDKGDNGDLPEGAPANLAFVGAETPTEPLLPARPLQAMATFLLLAVIVLGAFWVGRRPRPELH
jgi:stage II sporulation protein D